MIVPKRFSGGDRLAANFTRLEPSGYKYVKASWMLIRISPRRWLDPEVAMQSDEPAKPITEIPKNDPPPERQDTPSEIDLPQEPPPVGEPTKVHAE